MKPDQIQQDLKEAVFGSFMGIITEAVSSVLEKHRGSGMYSREWKNAKDGVKVLFLNGKPVLKFRMPKAFHTDGKMIIEFCVFDDAKGGE